MGRENPKVVRLAIDLGERVFVVLVAIPFLIAFAEAIPHRPHLILLMLSEGLAVALILTRKRGDVCVRAIPVLAAFLGTALPLMIRPGGIALIPPLASTVMMTAGLCLSVVAKVYLNRSFGLVAANRGIKVGGPYRVVRHPMYLGYFINQLGFLSACLSVTNLAIYLFAWSCQIVRMHEEETILQKDSLYRQFAGRVTAKLVPGVY
jgi:protein-S-isoprenylcysteine O-methyltransferase Ste14